MSSLLVIPSWYPNERLETQGLFFRDQTIALSKKFENTYLIYCHRGSFFKCSEYNDEGIFTTYLQYRLRLGALLGLFFRLVIFFVLYVRHQIKYGKPDVIHCHSVAFNQDGAAGIVGVLISLLFNIPIVITEHATIFKNKNYKWIEKKLMVWALNKCTYLVAVSDSLKNDLSLLINKTKKIHVIPNTLNISLFSPESPATRKYNNSIIRFVSVGYLMHKKGFDRLINLMLFLKNQNIDFELDIVGAGPLEHNLAYMIKTLKLDGNIKLLGERSKEEIALLLPSYDLFILLSRCETFGVVFIEALASGLFCIGTQCGGPEHILTDNRLGFIVENTENVSDYIDAIYFFKKNKYKLMSMENKEYRFEYSKNNYSYESFSDSFMNMFIHS